MIRLRILNKPKSIKLKCSFKFPDISKGILQQKEVIPTKETQEIVASAGYTALSKVIVDKIPDEYIIPSGDIEINQNGDYDVTDKKNAIVNIPEQKLGTKLITENGIYKAVDDDLDGYSEVEVSTSGVDINDYYNLNVNSLNFTDVRLFIIKAPPFNIETNVRNMSSLFYKYYLLKTISYMDTSNITNMASMFYGCNRLENIPQLDTGNVTDMASMFGICSALETVPQLNANKVNSLRYMFYQCRKLTNFGGLLNLGQAYLTSQSANYNQYQLDLSTSAILTRDSLINVVNGLYDIATKGVATQQLILGSTNITKLTAEEIAIATNKGWSVS